MKKIKRRRSKYTQEELNGARDALFEEIGISEEGKRACIGLMEAVKRSKGDPSLETLAECLNVQGAGREVFREVIRLLGHFEAEQNRIGIELVVMPAFKHVSWYREGLVKETVEDFKELQQKTTAEQIADGISPGEMRKFNEETIRSFDSWANDSRYPVKREAGKQIVEYLRGL